MFDCIYTCLTIFDYQANRYALRHFRANATPQEIDSRHQMHNFISILLVLYTYYFSCVPAKLLRYKALHVSYNDVILLTSYKGCYCSVLTFLVLDYFLRYRVDPVDVDLQSPSWGKLMSELLPWIFCSLIYRMFCLNLFMR